MGFFDIFTTKPKKQQASAKPMLIYKFVNTKHFRGFKRSSLSCHYGDTPKNLALFWHQDITDAEIVFEESRTQDNRPLFNVYLCGKHIGHVWDVTDTFARLINQQIEAVHLEIEDEIGLDGSVTGPKPKLLVKLKEVAQ